MPTVDPWDFRDLHPGERLLMGPAPSDVPLRVRQAMPAPCIGHLALYFLSDRYYPHEWRRS